MALKEPNLNNPWRQPGEKLEIALSALKELNIKFTENTFHLALYHTVKEGHDIPPQM
jgi:hypothetical protein